MFGGTDKQTARPKKTLKHYLLEISYLIFFSSFGTKFLSKIISVWNILGTEFILKRGHFCYNIWQVISFKIKPGHFSGGCELCKLRCWVKICIR